MMPSRLRGRALVFCLVLSSVGSCRTSAAPKGDQAGPLVKSPLIAAEPPPDSARSKWVHENWKLQKITLAKAGLYAVRLDSWQPRATPRNDPSPPWPNFGPELRCKLLEDLPGAPPRLIFSPSGQFVVSADGKVHCLVMDYQEIGKKKETVVGRPRNCGGGTYQQTPVNYHLYVVPADVPVGEAQTVRVPYYELDIRYEAECPMVPAARF